MFLKLGTLKLAGFPVGLPINMSVHTKKGPLKKLKVSEKNVWTLGFRENNHTGRDPGSCPSALGTDSQAAVKSITKYADKVAKDAGSLRETCGGHQQLPGESVYGHGFFNSQVG